MKHVMPPRRLASRVTVGVVISRAIDNLADGASQR
jgi:hypothetical protein